MAEFNITVTLATKTCFCGGTYAVPHWLPGTNYQCPMCAKRHYDALEQRYEARFDEIQQLKRTNAALRGAIKRKRGSTP